MVRFLTLGGWVSDPLHQRMKKNTGPGETNRSPKSSRMIN
jgi:hypothetical protein